MKNKTVNSNITKMNHKIQIRYPEILLFKCGEYIHIIAPTVYDKVLKPRRKEISKLNT